MRPIKTQASMSGFVVTDPVLSRPDGGQPRAYMRVGQEHYTPNEDGSFTQGEPSYHDLVVFGRQAEKAAAVFRKGDRFVAEGRVHTRRAAGPDGAETDWEEFNARRIGHDAAMTAYQVDRTPRRAQHAAPAAPQAARTGAGPEGRDPRAPYQDRIAAAPAAGM
ncbi:MAG: single-stranded DNA-binding protein [Bifidobacteriaceae bacterium]|nr:single-stranded DNA-binding protein [Bifidobacteriaceae bacterium]